MTLADTERARLESFYDVEMIGPDIADRISKWAQESLTDDELADLNTITPDMSGESAASAFTEIGVEESAVAIMLRDVGYEPDEESDDQILPLDVKRPKVVSERLNAFLSRCVESSAPYRDLVKEIEVKSLEDGGREEVRIVLFADTDLRRLPSSSPEKRKFMEYLQSLRSFASRFSMIDEAFCFSPSRKEFIISLKYYGADSSTSSFKDTDDF